MNYLELDNIILLAGIENDKGNYSTAESMAREVLAQKDSSELSQEMSCKALLVLAESKWRRGIANDALPYLEEALKLSNYLNNKALQAKTHSNFGNVYQILSDYSRALEFSTLALAECKALGMKEDVARVTHNIAIVYRLLADYPRSLEYSMQAVIANEELGMKENAARATGHIGSVYKALGDYPRALQYYGNALSSFVELGMKAEVALVTGNIGTVYQFLGDYPQALDAYSKALVVHQELGMTAAVARINGHIGSVYAELANYTLALEYFSKALQAHLQLDNKALVAIVNGYIGLAYYKNADYDRALEYYTIALRAHEALGMKAEHAAIVGHLGSLYANTNYTGYDSQRAEMLILQAITMNEELGTKQSLYLQHSALADLYHSQKRWEEAWNHKEIYYKLKDEVQSEEAKKQASKLEYERKEAEREKLLATERARREEREKVIDELTVLNSSLHEANRQKNEVIAIVAHDLKNPLAAILLCSETLDKYYSYLTKEDIQDKMSKIKLTAERMNLIILKLLDIQKLESGKAAFILQPTDVTAVIHFILEDYQDIAEKKNITINTAFADGTLSALSEQTALQEVVDNLVSNAIKYSHPGTHVHVRADADEQSIRISIQDQGPGLTDDDKKKLFGQFTRLSAKPTGGENSTGLGLSIVKRLVEMMSGRIWCESEHGKGATFIVELPRTSAE